MDLGDIVNLFKWFSFDNVINYLKQGILFYIKPKLFFTELLRRDNKNIIVQMFFYYFVIFSILFIATDREFKPILRSLLGAVTIQTVIDIFPIASGMYATSICFKLRRNLGIEIFNSIIYLLCCYVFLVPFFIVPLLLFEKSQEYEFLMLGLGIAVIIFYIKNILDLLTIDLQ